MVNYVKFLISTMLICIGSFTNVQAQGDSYFPFSDDYNYQRGQLIYTSLAALSYLGAELWSKDEKMNFYQAQADFYFASGSYTAIGQSFGVERRPANWFALGLETNIQEMFSTEHSTVGFGISGHFRWYLLGKSKWSPYFEYQNGVFYGATPFPEGAHNFTFRLIYKFGIEHTRENKDKVRLDFGKLHHSNSGLFEPNIGYDAYGVSMVYLWHWERN